MIISHAFFNNNYYSALIVLFKTIQSKIFIIQAKKKICKHSCEVFLNVCLILLVLNVILTYYLFTVNKL